MSRVFLAPFVVTGLAGMCGWVVGMACVFTPPPPLPEELSALVEAGKAPSPSKESKEPAAVKSDDSAPAQGEASVLQAGMDPAEVQAYAVANGDPEGGQFELSEALDGLEGEGELWVRFETARGPLECRLFEAEAPITVANFVGLARGLRPYRSSTGEWTKGAYYDGTTFHRVIPGFMIQGGDPGGTGEGNTGYVIVDEILPDLVHDRAGRLSMANRGPSTGSSQFFITLGPTPHLDGKHTIFGQCSDETLNVADDIAMTPRDPNDRPREPEELVKVEIVRRPAPEASAEPVTPDAD